MFMAAVVGFEPTMKKCSSQSRVCSASSPHGNIIYLQPLFFFLLLLEDLLFLGEEQEFPLELLHAILISSLTYVKYF